MDMKQKALSMLGMLVLAGWMPGLAAVASAADFPAGSPDFVSSYAEAAKLAKETGKPMLVVFSADWCGPCQRNKKEVYPSAEVKPYHDQFVWAYLDVDEKANEDVANAFKVRGIPHIQFVNAEGTQSLDSVVGMSSPQDFAKKLKKIAAKAGKAKD
jgi:thiol:disulfide interchange protein